MRRSIFVFLFLLVSFSASAQRTAIGTKFVSAEAVTSFDGIGGNIDVGMYNAVGMWRILLSDANRNFNLKNSDGGLEGKLMCMHLEAGFSHLWRIFANHSRTFNLYGGPGVFIGLETLDPFKKWPEGVVFPYETHNKFLYGADAQVQMEWFPFNSASNFAFVAGGRLPVNFSSQMRKFNWEVSLGIRINL